MKHQSNPEMCKGYTMIVTQNGSEMSHQVFEQSCQLFHQTGELNEGGPEVRAVSAHEVTAKLIQRLSVVLLILHVL